MTEPTAKRPLNWRQLLAPDMPERRSLSPRWLTLVKAIGAAFGVAYICFAFVFVDFSVFLSLYFGFTGVLAFLCWPARQSSPRERPSLPDIALSLLTIATVAWYIATNEERTASAGGAVPPLELAFGCLAIALSVEMCRRIMGLILPVVAVVLILYNIFGSGLPGILAHNGIAFSQFVSFVFSEEGIFGVVTSTFATYVFLFIVFGSFLQASGLGRLFIDLALALFGTSRGGAGKVAVAASGLLGTVLGSGAGNVVVTGSVTIPLMKRHGFKPEFAGAVEAVASLGGHLMPPVMGATAFVVAAFTKTDYAYVMLISVVPAVLYYVSLFATVHMRACREGITGLRRSEVPDWRQVLKKGWMRLMPLVILCVLLAWGYSAYRSAVFATLSIIVVNLFDREMRLSWRGLMDALADGAVSSVLVGVTGGVMGIVLAGVLLPGLALKFSSIVIGLSFGLLPVLLLLMALISYVLGMGMTILASYIVLAILAGPAMTDFGVPLLVTHMFLLWISQDASITPPFCINTFVAASIAKSNPMRTGFLSVYLGKPLYIIPILFVFTPMLTNGPWDDVIRTWVSCTLALILTSAALEGWLLRRTTALERGMLAVSALFLYAPQLWADAFGLLAGLTAFALQRRPLPQPVAEHVPGALRNTVSAEQERENR